MAHELDVWLFADRAGTLALAEGRLNFGYSPAVAIAAKCHCIVCIIAVASRALRRS
jgi:hypothetical protein